MQEARNAMKLHHLIGMIIALGAIAAVALVVPLAAQQGRNGQVHIVKDCAQENGIPGSDFCVIVSSNLPELPVGTRIYYDLSAIITASANGFFDQNIFVYVNDVQWAVGRCTGPNDLTAPNKFALCTLSDGVGQLAGFTARMTVTYKPGAAGVGSLPFGWDGTYSFNPLPVR